VDDVVYVRLVRAAKREAFESGRYPLPVAAESRLTRETTSAGSSLPLLLVVWLVSLADTFNIFVIYSMPTGLQFASFWHNMAVVPSESGLEAAYFRQFDQMFEIFVYARVVLIGLLFAYEALTRLLQNTRGRDRCTLALRGILKLVCVAASAPLARSVYTAFTGTPILSWDFFLLTGSQFYSCLFEAAPQIDCINTNLATTMDRQGNPLNTSTDGAYAYYYDHFGWVTDPNLNPPDWR